MSHCVMPFEFIEVHPSGYIFTCCPTWIKDYYIGNVYEDDFEKVWHSEKAITLRKKILNNDYSLCNRSICYLNEANNKENLNEYPDFPKYVKFCHNHECNYKCITCRDKMRIDSDVHLAYLRARIVDTFLPLLQNAEKVCLSGSGDPFSSRHYKELIKAIINTYPNIKFDLHTNGSLLNEKNCTKLGLLDKLSYIEISIHAATAQTYKTITRNGDFTKLLKNLQWLSDLKKAGKIDKLNLSFVAHKLNYQEMPDFVKLAEKFGAEVKFWGYRDWGTEFGDKYPEMAVFERSHPDFYKFQEMISSDIFNSPHCHLDPLFKEISQLNIK